MKNNTKLPYPPIRNSLNKAGKSLFGLAFVFNPGHNFLLHPSFGQDLFIRQKPDTRR